MSTAELVVEVAVSVRVVEVVVAEDVVSLVEVRVLLVLLVVVLLVVVLVVLELVEVAGGVDEVAPEVVAADSALEMVPVAGSIGVDLTVAVVVAAAAAACEPADMARMRLVVTIVDIQRVIVGNK